jgi:hypothetical protein
VHAAPSLDELLGGGQAQVEPFAFMRGLKVAPLPEGVSDSPLRAFSRFEQSIIDASLYPGPEEAASLEEQRRAYAVQLGGVQLGGAYAVQPEHTPEHTPGHTPGHRAAGLKVQPEVLSANLKAARRARPTVQQFIERPRTSGSTPSLRGLQARQAREAVRAGVDPNGRAGTAVTTPISQAQRTASHPALRGHRQKAAPARSAPPALAAARKAKADTQNVAEDLWEDLCCTLREL